jgi:hypothetical protein
MTIIAVQGDVMCADSVSFVNRRSSPMVDGKIARAPDGSLVGACGLSVDCYALRQWVLAGMDFSAVPKMQATSSSEDGTHWLWLKPDETVWFGDADFRVHPVANPVAMGMGAEFVDGMMAAGCGVERAVKVAIERIAYLGGPVQVERLDDPVVPDVAPTATFHLDVGGVNMTATVKADIPVEVF